MAEASWKMRRGVRRMQNTLHVAPAGGEADPDPGSEAEFVHHTNLLVAFAMGTHNRLGEGYSSRDGPCAVRLLAQNQDVLGLIGDWVRGRPRRTLEPPVREIHQLRRLNWQLEVERHGLNKAIDILKLTLDDVRVDLSREREHFESELNKTNMDAQKRCAEARSEVAELMAACEVCLLYPPTHTHHVLFGLRYPIHICTG